MNKLTRYDAVDFCDGEVCLSDDVAGLEQKLSESIDDRVRLFGEASGLKWELEQYRKTFEHYHVNDPNSDDDICKQCSLDLRNEIHTGVVRQ